MIRFYRQLCARAVEDARASSFFGVVVGGCAAG